MPKLTDTHLVVLSAAAQREDGAALPLPKSLKVRGAAVTKTLEGLCKMGLLEEKPASRAAAAWREEKQGQRMMLVITEAGLQALVAEPGSRTDKGLAATKTPADTPRQGVVEKRADAKSETKTVPSDSRRVTKQSILIDLLSQQSGATIAEMAQATGWQAHSVCGAISGTLKKHLGFSIALEKTEGRGRVYRIVEGS